MSRPLRIELAGGPYHVTSRGDGREAIYCDDQDRSDWLAVLGEVCRRFNWRCHAWCEMTNHYHIVEGVGLAIKHVGKVPASLGSCVPER